VQPDDSDTDDSTTFAVTCPYCGEQMEIYLEPDVYGTLVQDVTRGDGSD
jgi:hypothetical protein